MVISRGTQDGIESGHVLAILKSGPVIVDRSQPGERATLKLPDARAGLPMVFRACGRLSYELVLETSDPSRVGRTVTNQR